MNYQAGDRITWLLVYRHVHSDHLRPRMAAHAGPLTRKKASA